ncbi:hypothetical protein P3T37_002312 [Kitasatospora sp. MAA4]|nr:hypothetical protein [Kitasatospora sp. MAA4]
MQKRIGVSELQKAIRAAAARVQAAPAAASYRYEMGG